MSQKDNVMIRVWGDYACFTRPEFKAERVSYPVMTPSAARGVLEAIFWKPEMRFEIRRIGILKFGTQTVILRNELEGRQNKNPCIIENNRQQRASLILKDVEYLIEAKIRLRPHTTDSIEKYLDCFERRLTRGQYFQHPYLGTREFAAYFTPYDGEIPQNYNLHIGTMLFDIAFIEDAQRKELEFKRPDKKIVNGRNQRNTHGYSRSIFFNASVENGWINVPAAKYGELYKLEGNYV